MAQYSLFVLKVPLNPKQTNKTNVTHAIVVWIFMVDVEANYIQACFV